MTIEKPGAEPENIPDNLFNDVRYYLVGNISDPILRILNKGGGMRDTYLSEMVSHVIAESTDHDEYCQAKELFELPVVSCDWVILSAKLGRLLPKEHFSLDGKVFSNVVACPSDLEPEDCKAIWAMVTYHGGKCQLQLDRNCTHLITAAMEGAKYEAALRHPDKVKIVTPDWVTASIENKSREDEEIYNPKWVVYPQPTPPKTPTPPPIVPFNLSMNSLPSTPPGMVSLSGTPPGMYSFPPNVRALVRPEAMEVTDSGKVQFPQRRSSTDEGKAGSRPGTPSSITKEALARMVSSRLYHKTGDSPDSRPTVPPNPTHMSPQVFQQMQQMQATLAANQMLGSPIAGVGPLLPSPGPGQPSQHGPLLPSPQKPSKQSPQKTQPAKRPRAISNKPRKPRNQLRNITNNVDSGGPQLKTNANKINQMLGFSNVPNRPPPPYEMHKMHQLQKFPQTPTYFGYDPCDKVPPEACLLGCVFYITDYQKILEQEQINTWKQVIEQHGGQVDSAYTNRVTHLLCSNQRSDVFQLALKDQRRVVTAFWLNDCLVKKKMMPPWEALHLPVIYGAEKPCCNQLICVTNYDGQERDRVKQMIHAIGAKYTGYMTHSNSVVVCKNSKGLKYEKAKEWKIPIVNIRWLTDLILGDLNALSLPVNSRYLPLGQLDEFNIDLFKVSHLMVGWKNAMKIPKETWKRFVPNPNLRFPTSNYLRKDDVNEPARKKQRLEMENMLVQNSRGLERRVLFTGYPSSVTKKLQLIVERLGGLVVENPKNCTHLITQTISRTMKFFVAINVSHYILTKDWLEESAMQNRFLDEDKYRLEDMKEEKDLCLNVNESLRRARTRPLFKDLTFYVTPSVVPGNKDMRSIIESAGGIVVPKRHSVSHIQRKIDENGKPSYIVITCQNDIHLSRDMIANKIDVYNAEFVLTGVLRQEIDFELFRIELE